MYLVYKTTNTLNSKIYVGVHKALNLNDCYYGSGKFLLSSIDKYGKWNFEREILHIYYSKEVAYKRESYIVNKEFLEREDTYNIKLGGIGGWEYINSHPEIQLKSLNSRLEYYRKKRIPGDTLVKNYINSLSVIEEPKLIKSLPHKMRNLYSEEAKNKAKAPRAKTNLEKYGKIEGKITTREVRDKGLLARKINLFSKYPELSIICHILNPDRSMNSSGSLYEMSKLFQGWRKACSNRSAFIKHLDSQIPIGKGKWKGYFVVSQI